METKFTKFLLLAMVLVLITGCATMLAKRDANCIDKKYEELRYKICASQSLIERDLPRDAIQALFDAEQKRSTEYIKSTYKLANYNIDELSRKWNQTVTDIADLPSPIRSIDDFLSLGADNTLSEFKKSDPDLYDFIMRNLREFLESAPQPVYREKRGQIILENDPIFYLFPLIFEKIIVYLKQTGKVSKGQEKEIRKQLDKGVTEFISIYTSISKYCYPIQYDFLVMELAKEELYKIYASVNKAVFIIREPSFEGARCDHVGNLLLSKAFIRDLDKKSLETIMVHEAVHLLKDNSNPIIMFLFKKNLDRWKTTFKPIIEQLSGETIDHDDIQQIETNFKLLENVLDSLKYEISIDIDVLYYFAKQPSIREEYANVIASFEKVPRERVAVIDAINEYIDSGEAEKFQLHFAIEGGVLLDKSQIQSMSKCSMKLKVAFKEYFKHTTKQMLSRMLTKDADLLFQRIYDVLKRRSR